LLTDLEKTAKKEGDQDGGVGRGANQMIPGGSSHSPSSAEIVTGGNGSEKREQEEKFV